MAKKAEAAGGEDPVNPAHYKQGAVECIDAIRSMLGEEGYRAWLRGTICKYVWRLAHKGCAELDAGKMAWYVAKLKESLEGDRSEE